MKSKEEILAIRRKRRDLMPTLWWSVLCLLLCRALGGGGGPKPCHVKDVELDFAGWKEEGGWGHATLRFKVTQVSR